MENREHLQLLLEKHVNGTATEAESQSLMEAIALHTDQQYWEKMLEPFTRSEYAVAGFNTLQWNDTLQFIFRHKNTPEEIASTPGGRLVHRSHFLRLGWFRYAAAAMVILAMITGYLVFFNKPKQVLAGINAKDSLKKDIAPGGNKAILTLANGSHIILDNASNGALVNQGNTKVVKLADGMLAYKQSGIHKNEILYNTMTTPRGGEYSLTLPDGSTVWLNASSSITYPTAFTGEERNVSVTGEVYFEVAKKANQPFHVKVNDIVVEVLGTHFDINSYADEVSVKTTLLEGKVKVTKGLSSVKLVPGDQAQVDIEGILKVEKDADIEKAMAWKEGKFLFDKDEIPAILRQVSRWYDVEVVYKAALPRYRFSGIIRRNRTLSEVLTILQGTEKIHFSIEGKKILVLP